MASTIKVNNIQNQCGANIINESANTITIGASGDTITLACGASQTGFGRTGTVDWDTTAKTASFTAVSGNGYFVNTTSGAITVTLPAGSAGDIVSLKDYANTWDTNNVTVTPNGTDKINGSNGNSILNTEDQSVTLVYVDDTKGWRAVQDSTSDVTGTSFITATGGTIETIGDYKIHTFTGPGTFCVTAGAGPLAVVDYMVVAGGGGGATFYGGGGGGGFRFSADPVGNPQSGPGGPLNADSSLPIVPGGFPVTVGGGASNATGPSSGSRGSNSIFSTITSTGGGGGNNTGSAYPEGPGGSGGGGGATGSPPTQGTGNSPSVSPPQGQPGGNGLNVPGICNTGGGGGGAVVAGSAGLSPYRGGDGGDGAGVTGFGASNGQCSSCVQYFSGGGGGKTSSPGYNSGLGGLGGGARGTNPSYVYPAGAGTANTGGGGGGGPYLGPPADPGESSRGGNGGSGIVVIRYKYQ